MALFKYEALDSQGSAVSDQIEALSQEEAISKIRNMGYFPTDVKSAGAKKKKKKKKAGGGRTAPSRKGAKGKVKPKVITEFARQFSTLQDAGLPILRSLRILEQQEKKGTFKNILKYIGDDIEGGSTLSESMARFPKAFDRLVVGMVAAGEAGGVLDLILARIAEFLEKNEKLKSRVKSAMVYPAVVLMAAFVILLGLMKFVIPQFKAVLEEMVEGELNAVTQTVLGVSNWIAYEYGWLILICIPFVTIFILKILRRFKGPRYVLDLIKSKLPIIGKLSTMIALTRWTRTLGTLISAGVPILDAINTSRETAGNEIYTKALGQVHYSIKQGESFAEPLEKSKTVDLIVSNMIAVGEETGDLDKMLIRIADNYDEKVDVMVESMMSLLEPIMIIVLGGVIMVIVLAVFLPMIQVITSLSGG
jgi:type IV pilus assembly protein PilC